MTEFIQDKWLKFAIDHYREIESINEIYDMAKKKLPEMVTREIIDSIKALEGTFFAEKGLECGIDDSNEIWWFDSKAYNSETDKGAYFSFEPISNFSQLLPDITKTEASWLVVYYEPANKKKADKIEELGNWIDEFKKHKTGLEKKQIKIQPYSEDPQYLAAYYLNKEVNLDVLKTTGELRKGIQKAVQDFTSAILPIIKKIAE